MLIAGPLLLIGTWGSRAALRRFAPVLRLRRERVSLLDHMNSISTDGYHAELAALLQDYLRLRFDLPPGELSASALDDILAGAGIDHNRRDELAGLLDRLDTGRFAVSGSSADERAELIRRARSLCEALEASR